MRSSRAGAAAETVIPKISQEVLPEMVAQPLPDKLLYESLPQAGIY